MAQKYDLFIDQNPEAAHDDDPEIVHNNPVDVEVQETPNVNVNDGDAPLKRSQRIRRLEISSDYIIYLREHEFDVCDTSDLSTY